jgi:cardiolipin synthase (CMP-forming)
VSLTFLILGRDVSLAIAAIYYRYASLPQPKTFARYWDFSLPSAEVHPTFLSKVNTSLQLVLIGTAILLPVLPSLATIPETWDVSIKTGMLAFQTLVAGTTLWSGASYAWRKDVVKILGKDETLKKKQGVRGRMIIGVSYAVFVAMAAYFFQQEMIKRKEVVDKEE